MTDLEVMVDFCDRLSAASIRHVIGGSVAAGVWGDPRQTNDIDVEIWLESSDAANLMNALPAPYVISGSELNDELASEGEIRVFQVLQSEDIVKFDCFLQGRSKMDEEAYARATPVELLPGKKVVVASAEHIFVRKLRWYEESNRTSERQWNDLLAIARVSTLDWGLINRWADPQGIADLAEMLRKEVTE